MKKIGIYLMLISLIALACTAPTESEPYPESDGLLDPYEQADALGKGINFGNLLDAYPEEGAWSDGYLMQESDFDLAVEAGFDSVRIPVRFSDHASENSPYTIDEEFFQRVDEVVNWGLDRDLKIVIDMHHFLELNQDPRGNQVRYIYLWKQIAERYKDYPDGVYYEILNEPSGELYGETWNDIIGYSLRAIRKIDNHHTVIVSSASWGNISALQDLIIPEEETNAIVTFHYYTPFYFCFQGKDWAGPDTATTGIIWPGPPDEPLEPSPDLSEYSWARDWINDYNTISSVEDNPAGYGIIRSEIAQAAAWGEENGRPLWMSEFCAQDGADLESRARWASFVRQELESHGIPWSYWTLNSDLGTFLYNNDTEEWTTELTDALGLTIE